LGLEALLAVNDLLYKTWVIWVAVVC